MKGKSEIENSILILGENLLSDKFVSGYDLSILDELVKVMKKIYIWCKKKQIEKYLKYFIDVYR